MARGAETDSSNTEHEAYVVVSGGNNAYSDCLE